MKKIYSKLTMLFFLCCSFQLANSQCGTVFTDPGGDAAVYPASSAETTVICPDAGQVVSVTFTTFSVEDGSTDGCWDDLQVWQDTDGDQAVTAGVDTQFPGGQDGTSGGYCGSLADLPNGGVFTSTTADDCLVFIFSSDTAVSEDGWTADVTCFTANSCTILSAGLTVSPCDDGGTPDDPADDFYTFTLDPDGLLVGTTYSVLDATGATIGTGTYGTPFTSGAFPAGVDVAFSIVDGSDTACTFDGTATAPATCSPFPPPSAPLNCTSGSPFPVFLDEMGTATAFTGVSAGNVAGTWSDTDGGSTGTGPGPNSNPQGGDFVMFEASGSPFPPDTIVSPPINLTNATSDAELIMGIHMFGGTMGSLEIQVTNDGGATWTTLYLINGALQTAEDDPFFQAGFDLSAYLGQTIQVQFIATGPANTDFESDIAIDYVEVSACVSSAVCILGAVNPTVSACNDGGTDNDVSDDTFTVDIDPTGAGTSTYSVTDGNGATLATGLTYGAAATIGPFVAGGGDVIINVTDDGDPDCTLSITATDPGSCSPVPACGGPWYDSGGPTGDYGNAEDIITTICPDNPGEIVSVAFTSFSSENGFDEMLIFDGPDTILANSPAILTPGGSNEWEWDLNDTPPAGTADPVAEGPFVSTHPSGCLTFYWNSDGSVTRPGWAADVTCFAPNNCAILSPGLTVSACDNAGTGNDPADDFFTFSIDPTGLQLGTTYIVRDAATSATIGTGTYGTPFTSGAFPAGGGDFDILIQDGTDGNCFLTVTVTDPGSCAVACSITGATIVATCDDGGTDNDVSDDSYSFTLDPTGVGFNASYSVTDTFGVLIAGGLTYGTPANFGPFPPTQDQAIIIVDDADGACADTLIVAATGTCSPVPSCGGPWYDNGGQAGLYAANSADTTTICPENAGDIVSVTFTYVDLETAGANGGSNTTGCWDYITVWDGPSTASTNLGDYCGEASGDGGVSGGPANDLPIGTVFTSTDASGCLTVTFLSDGAVQETGWEADVVCFSPANCSILTSGLTVSDCNNAGTGNDPADDFFTFTIDPTGLQLGTTYTVVDAAGATIGTGTYGTPFTSGALPAGGGDVAFTIVDGTDTACTFAGTATDPGSCAVPCSITGATIVATCDDGGTDNDTSDDTFTYTLDPTGAGFNATYTLTDLAGTVIAAGLTYGTPYTSGTFAAGSGNIDVVITDDGDTACTFQALVTDPGTCSPVPSCGGPWYDNGGQAGTYLPDSADTTTICPDNAGDIVSVTFTYVDIETSQTAAGGSGNGCWDFITVFDGASTAATNLGDYCGEASGDGGVTAGPANDLPIGTAFTSTDASGCLTFTFSSDGSVNETGWEADVVCFSPNSCSILADNLSVSACDNGGTGNNPADDTFTFTIDPTGLQLGTTYTVVDAAGATIGTGTYGTPFTSGALPAGGGDVAYTIVDGTDTACTFAGTATDPGSCAVPCSITGATIVATCDDGGTDNDTSDDTFTYTLDPTGAGFNATYTLTDLAGAVIASGLTYGTPYTSGTFAAGSGNIDVVITDDGDAACTFQALVTDPGTCSPVPSCGGPWYDNGGQDGLYAANSADTTTICPENAGDIVSVTFTYVDLETAGANGGSNTTGCWDYITVWDGPSTASTNLGDYCGEASGDGGVSGGPANDLPIGTTFTSTDPSGCLTVTFLSDGAVQETGWEADVVCFNPASCAITATGIGTSICDDGGTNNDTSDDTFTFTLDPTGLQLGTTYTVLDATGATIGTGTYGTPFTSGVFPAGGGDVAFTIIDGADTSCTLDGVATDPGSCSPVPSCGGTWYDSGGPTGDYSSSEDIITTICPDNAGDVVTVAFTTFSTENGFDEMLIFDGPDTVLVNSPAILTSGGSNEWEWDLADATPSGTADPVVEGPFTSTHPSGCLTFYFNSDGSITREGWEANVTCAPPAAVSGCTDPCDPNYNADATVSDPAACAGYDTSCNTDCTMGDITVWDAATCGCILQTTTVNGCTDASACNFDPAANCDDGSCDPGNTGCTDPCDIIIGCTDPGSCNYNPTACVDDGQCTNVCNPGCTDPCAPNFNPNADGDDGSCMMYDTSCNSDCTVGDITVWDATACACVLQTTTVNGCTNPNACNFDMAANCDDNSCDFGNSGCVDPCDIIIGCTDPTACNYNPTACVDDGQCIQTGCAPGCTDPCDPNYNPTADSLDPNACAGYSTDCNTDCTLGDITVWDANACACVLQTTTVNGCTDTNACNFDTAANCDDNSCDYGIAGCPDPCNALLGCTDPVACNYNPAATCDNGSCVSAPCNEGCTDPCAPNYDATADGDDGSCEMYDTTCDTDICTNGGTTVWDAASCSCVADVATVSGCTDAAACNYDPAANCDDSSCDLGSAACADPCNPVMGCTNTAACNYDPAACVDDNSCDLGNTACADPCNPVMGCTDATACNYDPTACVDDGNCAFAPCNPGCTDPCAANYMPDADSDDGSCTPYDNTCDTDICTNGGTTVWDTASCSCVADVATVNGCTDAAACNYDPAANCDDSSCDLGNTACADPCNPISGCTDATACNYDPTACVDDGSCEFAPCEPGCTDPCAANYNPNADEDDGSCEVYDTTCDTDICTNGGTTVWDAASCSCVADVATINGCTDAAACNYDAAANCDDDSCDFGNDACADPCNPVMGCTDAMACNFDDTACVDDGSCDLGNTSCPDPCNAITGCTDAAACNYDAAANCDDGSCDFTSCIGGLTTTVYVDANVNNTFDAGDVPIVGALVDITDGATALSIVTDANGQITVTGLAPGAYTVTVTLPGSFAFASGSNMVVLTGNVTPNTIVFVGNDASQEAIPVIFSCDNIEQGKCINRQGALFADDDFSSSGNEVYTWYVVNADGSSTQVAQFTGVPYYSPSALGDYFVIVYEPDFDCEQEFAPRTITTLDGCCEIGDEDECEN